MSESIRYYSTNRTLDPEKVAVPFIGTVSFREALLMGQAPDEGLFIPERIPEISLEDIPPQGQTYTEAACWLWRPSYAGAFTNDA